MCALTLLIFGVLITAVALDGRNTNGERMLAGLMSAALLSWSGYAAWRSKECV